MAQPHIISDSQLERAKATFWNKVNVGAADECWEWKLSCGDRGYGRVRIDGIETKAHRIALALSGVAVTPDMLVCHRCDNPPCCNPSHLFLGSSRDNAVDCVRKGRRIYEVGEANGRAVLTEEQVREIRSSNLSGPHLARLYGVETSTISAVRNRKSWRHVQ